MAFCSSCGAEVAGNAAFCPRCGKPTAAASAGPAAPAPAAAPAAGLQDNVAGLLCYFLIPAIIFLVMEPYNRNKFIRFHAFQSIIYEIVWIVVAAVVGMLPIINLLLLPVASLAFFIGWIICLIKAFQGQMFKLPVIGEIAEKQAGQ
ncbi:MAG TPA: zinc-ribbon domain-containing protein [Terriglobales bacterium]|nr:zinc-ribbon domain-containing protein [Terriglobales bacterium]